MSDNATFLYTLAETLVNAAMLLLGDIWQQSWIVRRWKGGRMVTYQVIIIKLPEPEREPAGPDSVMIEEFGEEPIAVAIV